MHIAVIGGAFIAMMLLLVCVEKIIEFFSFLKSVISYAAGRRAYMRPKTRYYVG